ncbi:Methyltransf-18 multi-domain protein [Pyrenophora tritici-repentis]|uniref:Methyltransferase type 11 domain-containing protein n=1 Tax=Cochliobolus carbonum (strain 26-R-13) TaxID=930089 RepID=W6XMU4_COCC2|nr:uncharacterized protein COCCADRAFT_10396 [Bipolaris zeicola 26-R-13]EUC26823.1 hypothetical protein COCCADRAFT_10396 [Bipolaris zeicola 26-R-13]KAI1676136.1 Methyltransf-18 multi-domain protein [Pyrenophora tritici-repentis]
MVYFATDAEINQAYTPLIGVYDYVCHAQYPDTDKALALANLSAGESVLEVGAGGGRLIARAKRTVGSGFCVAVDAVQGFVSTDIPWMLQQQGLAASPSGTPATQVHCLCANITSSNFANTVRAVPGAPQQFDCIVAVHLFTTLAPSQRRQALVTLRQLLSPSGRLVLNMSARFTNSSLQPANAALPVQFRNGPYTETAGATIYTLLMRDGPRVPIPGASATDLPRKVIELTYQTAPNRLWTVAAAQAREAAEDAGFSVSKIEPIGKGDDFGLPDGRHSLTHAELRAMNIDQLVATAKEGPIPRRYNCMGRTAEAYTSRIIKGWEGMGPQARDFALAKGLQDFVAKEQQSIAFDDSLYSQAGGPIRGKSLDVAQVGVLLRLTKM